MAGIESDVIATFMHRLKASDDVPPAVREKLAIVLAKEKLPKPEALAMLYRAESGDPVA